jgi:hypothetical protein
MAKKSMIAREAVRWSSSFAQVLRPGRGDNSSEESLI